MKLSRNFVREYVDIPVDTKTLAEDMTSIGNEYDSVVPLIPCTNLVVGEVLDCIDHPDSDHLHVCKVNVGNEVLQIVCGAPNVRTGLKVIVALSGANLPGGIIKKGVIRGVESNGMLCSMAELGLEHKYLKEEDSAGIHELPLEAKVGEDAISYLEMDDEIIDFELTSNRGDLLSILGMAYEIGALYQKPVKDIDLTFKENKEDIHDLFSIDIQTEQCSLFLAKMVKNVVIKESPTFIKNRLIASGIRPINNVVDISNYVMLETGQPLHYYDYNRLGNYLSVRMAKEGEELTTLDGQKRILSSSDIVIADKTSAIGLAGVMGGLTTEIEDDTKNIVIESAIFDATSIRRTSKKVLRSEASIRFEKGLDAKRTYMAMMRSCHLLEKYADAEIVSGIVEYNHADMSDRLIEITVSKINKILGTTIEKSKILTIFTDLGFSVEERSEDLLVVHVPSRRGDISIVEDLIEEVGRMYGIDKIEGHQMVLPVKPGYVNKDNRYIRNKLTSLGLNETLSYALIKDSDVHTYSDDEFEMVRILDPMTEDRNTLRYNILPSLMYIYEYNKKHGNRDVSIYEIGACFSKGETGYFEEEKLGILMSGDYGLSLTNTKVDFYTLKGILEELLESLGYKNRYRFVEKTYSYLHPGQSAALILNNVEVGLIGKIHPNITKDSVFVAELQLEKIFDFRVKKMQYKEFSRYPSVSKDVAFVVSSDTPSSKVEEQIKKSGGKLLTNIRIFDVYKGENVGQDEKSLAYTLTFSDATRTLTEEEVMVVFNKIMNEVSNRLGAKVRDE